jgi:transposase
MGMHRTHGRSRRGSPARKKAKCLKGENHSTWGAVLPDHGLLHYFIIPGTSGKPGEQTALFTQFCEETAEILRKDRPDGRVYFIMDNASFHSKAALPEALAKFNVEIHFLSRYSPQFNPIENCFGIWKNAVHKLPKGSNAELIDSIQKGTKAVTREVTMSCHDKCYEAYHKALMRLDF